MGQQRHTRGGNTHPLMGHEIISGANLKGVEIIREEVASPRRSPPLSLDSFLSSESAMSQRFSALGRNKEFFSRIKEVCRSILCSKRVSSLARAHSLSLLLVMHKDKMTQEREERVGCVNASGPDERPINPSQATFICWLDELARNVIFPLSMDPGGYDSSQFPPPPPCMNRDQTTTKREGGETILECHRTLSIVGPKAVNFWALHFFISRWKRPARRVFSLSSPRLSDDIHANKSITPVLERGDQREEEGVLRGCVLEEGASFKQA